MKESRDAGSDYSPELLNSVSQKLAQLERGLGAGDRAKLDEYFEAVRDVERRIQKAEEKHSQEVSEVGAPAGIPDDFEEHAQLMYDLLALAYQVDLTRVITFMIGRESSGRTFPQLGISDAHHPLSHHLNDPEKLARLTKINTYHITLFGQFLEKLRSTPDGDGSLLDHVMIIYGSGMSNGNGHDPLNLPILLAGGGGGQLKTGRHIRLAKDTPLANLHLTVLDKLGVHHVDKITSAPRPGKPGLGATCSRDVCVQSAAATTLTDLGVRPLYRGSLPGRFMGRVSLDNTALSVSRSLGRASLPQSTPF